MPAPQHKSNDPHRRTPPGRYKPTPRRGIFLYLSENSPRPHFYGPLRVPRVSEVPRVIFKEGRADEHSIFARVTTQHFVACASHHDAQIVLDCEFNCGLQLCGVGWPRDEGWLEGGVRVVFHVC